MLQILFNTIAPIFLIISVAYLVSRKFPIDPRTLSRLSIYIFAPALVLSSIARSQMGAAEIGAIVLGAALVCALMGLIGNGLARLLRLERKLASTFTLTVLIMNAVNFGYPFITFAFGEVGLETAVLYGVGLSLAANTLGIYVASRGSQPVWRSLRNVFLTPLPYALLLGVVLSMTAAKLPLPLMRATNLLADATVPVALIILGLQLGTASVNGRIGPIFAASGTRLILGPLVGLLIASGLGLQGISRQVFVLESSMPAGVFSGVLATEYGGDAEFATATILVSTVLSAFTLGVILLFI